MLGTTVSQYLFFWQDSQEVEEVSNNRGEKALKRTPGQAHAQLGRIRVDTYLGMAFSGRAMDSTGLSFDPLGS